MKKNSVRKFFNNFSKTYNQKAFRDSKGLDYLNHLEIDFIKKNCSSRKIKNLLEIGFGAGRNLEIFKNKQIEIYGVDIAEKMIKETLKSFSQKKIHLKHLNAEKGLPFKDNFFDLILCIRVLKYMKKWPFVLKEISRTLKKGAYSVLESPNLFSIHFFGLPWANYFLFPIWKFTKELKRNKLEIVKIKKGALFPFFIYKRINNPKVLRLISAVDKKANQILPLGIGSRNYLFLVKKIS
ncbi:MAG: class I SAM-dependent methyltransferase [Candidatus Shapirobacteria bacterium]